MTTAASSLFRSLLIYCICVPLALVLGYMISTPYDLTSFTMIGAVLCFLLVPLMLRWHHVWLIATWNLSAVVFFLPGRPQVWFVLAWISLLISFVGYILNRKQKFIYVSEIAKPLILLVIIALITAKFRGGFGMQSLGSDTFGSRRYFMIVTAVVGFFAIASQRIPPHRVPLYVALYFLSAVTTAIGELAVVVSPAFYFLFWVFPVGSEGLRAIAGDPTGHPGFSARITGLASAGTSVYLLMLCRYGIAQLISWRHIVRLVIFISFFCIALLGGFRSTVIMFFITFVILFYLEGLMASAMLPVFLLMAVLGAAIIVPLADRLPDSIQRSISFLPIKVDPMIKATAESSTDWRVQMWKHVLPEVPEYLILGKGYALSPKDLALTHITNSADTGTEGAELAGDYHNGPLSVIIPFGILGTVAFFWFLIAGYRVLRRNYLFGDPALRRINTFLLAYYIAKSLFFCAVFGGLYSDLMSFTGLLAMSISINGGVAEKVPAPEPEAVTKTWRLHPPRRKLVGV